MDTGSTGGFAELVEIPLETLQMGGRESLLARRTGKIAQAMKVSPDCSRRTLEGKDFYLRTFRRPIAPEDLLLSVRGGTILDFTDECEVIRFPRCLLGIRQRQLLLSDQNDNMIPKSRGGLLSFRAPRRLKIRHRLMRIGDDLSVAHL